MDSHRPGIMYLTLQPAQLMNGKLLVWQISIRRASRIFYGKTLPQGEFTCGSVFHRLASRAFSCVPWIQLQLGESPGQRTSKAMAGPTSFGATLSLAKWPFGSWRTINTLKGLRSEKFPWTLKWSGSPTLTEMGRTTFVGDAWSLAELWA